MTEKQTAACALVLKGTQILGVSRKDDHTAFGIPGGKVEDGEDPEETLVRELLEETGLTAENWHLIYIGDVEGWEVHTFYVEASGTLQTEEEGIPRWVTPQVLLDGPFGEFNKQLFQKARALGILHDHN